MLNRTPSFTFRQLTKPRRKTSWTRYQITFRDLERQHISLPCYFILVVSKHSSFVVWIALKICLFFCRCLNTESFCRRLNVFSRQIQTQNETGCVQVHILNLIIKNGLVWKLIKNTPACDIKETPISPKDFIMIKTVPTTNNYEHRPTLIN